MTLLLFEDHYWRNFAPIVQTRPLYELRCGGFTLRERLTQVAALHGESIIAGLCRPHLMGAYGPRGGMAPLLGRGGPLVLVNARALHLDWLPKLLGEPVGTTYVADGFLLGARISPSLASAIIYYLSQQQASDALEELLRFSRYVEIKTTLLAFPWDLIATTGEQLVLDMPLLAQRIPRYPRHDPHIVVHNPEHIFVAPTARLDGPIVLDARNGPIVIDEAAQIEPFSFIQGPTFIGPGSLIASARIRGETSIGPICRVGGEVEASIIQGFSNKHHDGFLGHSWLGEWVNVGAMTTNSDLKNNYGSVRLVLEGIGQIDSGMMKIGCFLADHVKLGIGLHLNGGTIIATASNIFGTHTSPKTVPAFVWGSDVFREYRVESMIDVAKTVMRRRKRDMTSEYETMLRAVFLMTRPSRGQLAELAFPARALSTSSEAALANAEAEAVRAFEDIKTLANDTPALPPKR